MIAALLDHLWQSSLFAGLIASLTFILRRQPAALRYRLWLLASLKFLVPFAPLAMLGAHLSVTAPRAAAPLLALQPAAARLAAPAGQLPLPGEGVPVEALLLVVWALGALAVTAPRMVAAIRLHRLSRQGRDTGMPGALPVKAAPSLLEPGLVGWWKPVVLMPAGLLPLLSPEERAAILAHEAAHWRRRDNLTAGLHMLVEALFWFMPPVWLIGRRLLAERERACDEGVLAQGHDAQTYAGAILKACRFCIRLPVPCVSGATGALALRIGHIMTPRDTRRLDAAGVLLVTAALLAAPVLPLVSGLTHLAPLAAVAAVEEKTQSVVADAAARVLAVPAAHLSARRLSRVRLALDAALPTLPVEEPVVQSEPVAPPAPTPVAAPELARAEAVTAPARHVVELDPKGDGAPGDVVCRARQTLPGSRLPGPVVCRTNQVWASLYANHQEISADGTGVEGGDPAVYGRDTRNCAVMVSGSGRFNSLSNIHCF